MPCCPLPNPRGRGPNRTFPSQAGNLLRKFRSGLEGTGTCFGLEYTITHDYEPDSGQEFSPSTFLVGLEVFPRSGEHVPEWLREKIRQAREDHP